MRVRMKAAISGTRNGAEWPPAGESVDLPDDEAAQLCEAGLAEPVTGEDGPETATVADTSEKRGRGRPRKTGSAEDTSTRG